MAMKFSARDSFYAKHLAIKIDNPRVWWSSWVMIDLASTISCTSAKKTETQSHFSAADWILDCAPFPWYLVTVWHRQALIGIFYRVHNGKSSFHYFNDVISMHGRHVINVNKKCKQRRIEDEKSLHQIRHKKWRKRRRSSVQKYL